MKAKEYNTTASESKKIDKCLSRLERQCKESCNVEKVRNTITSIYTGCAVKDLRDKSKMTQGEFAKKLCVSRRTIQRLEARKEKPIRLYAKQLKDALKEEFDKHHKVEKQMNVKVKEQRFRCAY